MKKKLLASLLVGSAVVGASLAPLSAQATTTGKTPVTVGFEGGTLPDQDNNNGPSIDPDPTKPNSDFDLLAIPRSFPFSNIKIGEDVSSINITAAPLRQVAVGDLRGTKEGWHLTGELDQMKNGTDILEGSLNFDFKGFYTEYQTAGPTPGAFVATSILNGINIADDPTAPNFIGTSMKMGGGATTLITAEAGKGQGLWAGEFRTPTLNVTTPTQQLKKGAYTGTITWNLVAGPSTPAPAPGPAN